MTESTAADKTAAACTYITETIDGLKKLNTAVCNESSDSGEAKPPVPEPPKPDAAAEAAARKVKVEGFLEKIKTSNPTRSDELTPLTVDPGASPDYAIFIKGGKTDVPVINTDAEADIKKNIGDMLQGEALTGGGRRGKRSARKGRKSSKGGRRSRKGKGKRKGKKSRRGGRRSRISRH